MDDFVVHGRQLPPGPWTEEPDQWEGLIDAPLGDGQTGAYLGLAVRSLASRAWNGYVAIPRWHKHPWDGKSGDEINGQVHVHGGVTWASELAELGVHVPEWWQDDAWVIGFDCAHAGDIMPIFPDFTHDETYRDLVYVKQQISWLALQASQAARR